MIYYLCYYSFPQANTARYAAPAANNKVKYISDVLNDIDTTRIVSLSELSFFGAEKGFEKKTNNNVTYKCFFSLRSKRKLIAALGHLLTKISAFLYLITRVKKQDVLIVYHSLASMRLVIAVKKLKRCKLIVEVEELYSDVRNDSKLKTKELRYFRKADDYIFITNLLEQRVNIYHKPFAISHGTYQCVSECAVHPFTDGKVHVVYAGTLNRTKGGVYNAIKAADYLDESFIIHILGKGNDTEEDEIRTLIEDSNIRNKCKICFEGFYTGNELNAFIQSCDIGISSQPANATFNDSSFPSKILMYLSNGIKVVSVEIPAVKYSDVGHFITYYQTDSPLKIADAIVEAANASKADTRSVLHELDKTFRDKMTAIIVD